MESTDISCHWSSFMMPYFVVFLYETSSVCKLN